MQVINLWRPIPGPLRDAPLAVCDALSIASEGLVPSDLIYRDRVGEIYGVTRNKSDSRSCKDRTAAHGRRTAGYCAVICRGSIMWH